MANLIITIISLAIVGIAAAMGVYYGGIAFNGSQGQILANTLISESQQLMAADTEYMLDKGLGSFADFGPDAPVIANYTQGRVPIMGLPAYGFIPFVNQRDEAVRADDPSNEAVGELGGQSIFAFRVNYVINGTNVIVYNIRGTYHDLSPAAQANDILVQICKAINNTMPPPAGIAYTDSGIPEMDAGTSTSQSTGNSDLVYYTDTSRTTLNYCYTPPAGNTYDIYFVFSN